MERRKKEYMTPETEVTHVEIESSICGGSVEFGDKKDEENDDAVMITRQGISGSAGDANDFSGETWGQQPSN